jgi:hypothetical protein
MSAKRGAPSRPIATWPSSVKALRSRPGPAAKIKQRQTIFAGDILQHRRNVLTDVVFARSFPERFGPPVVLFQSARSDFFQILGFRIHVGLAT